MGTVKRRATQPAAAEERRILGSANGHRDLPEMRDEFKGAGRRDGGCALPEVPDGVQAETTLGTGF